MDCVTSCKDSPEDGDSTDSTTVSTLGLGLKKQKNKKQRFEREVLTYTEKCFVSFILQNVYVPPLPPEALIPFEPSEKQKLPLIR